MSSGRTESRFGKWRALVGAALLAGLWAVWNPGDHKSWIVGAPVVAVASVVAAQLGRGGSALRVNVAGAARFAAFFGVQSFRGGWDVARRAFSPRMTLRPALVTIPRRLREVAAQVFLANVVSLLPGTVSADLADGAVTLHALDASPATLAEVRALEERIAALFGLAFMEKEEAAT
jgi:multicomponent Na+:H+ antiporter subunit E